MTDPENTYRFLTVSRTIVECNEAEAMAFIDRLSERYWGCEFPTDRDTNRIKLRDSAEPRRRTDRPAAGVTTLDSVLFYCQ